MRTSIRLATLALAAAAACAAPSAAFSRGAGAWGGSHGGAGWNGSHGGTRWVGHPGGRWHGYYGGWGLGLGVGIGVGLAPWWYPSYGVYDPGYVVATPVYPVTVVPNQISTPMAPSAPDPVVYPRNGQSPQQTETDRRDCDRWAMTQPRAMADASVFHRATIACLEGRGYTVR